MIVKKGGKITAHGRIVVSADGKSRVVTLIGIEYRCSAARLSFETDSIFLSRSFEKSSMNVHARTGMSSTRSRSGGMVI
jgi:hypothetical protein